MTDIFEIKVKDGRKIRLPQKQWSHINQRHPNVEVQYIEETLNNPTNTIFDEENNITLYYKYFKHRKESTKYLKVMVKYLNGEVTL